MNVYKSYIIILKKELKEAFGNPQILIPTFVVPSVLLIILPIVFFLIILNFSSEIQRINMPQSFFNFQNSLNLTDNKIKEMSFRYIIDYIFPLFFLLVPIMASSVFGASSFVAEKEGQTIETIFYTPLTLKQLFISKILSVFSIAILISFLMFIPFSLIVNIFALKIVGEFIFPDIKWILLLFWVSPALIFFTISFIVWISSWARSFQAAQQVVGLIILPFVGFFIASISGVFVLNVKLFILAGLIVWILAMINLKWQSLNWKYEKFLK